ncbi:MAG TPA: hypothetical protein VHB50_08055, partial [Bryobacteraceae bacterium]|nr:hypothetical protein [Bryobacteraceae bacterium]
MNEEYLWNGGGEPDETTVRLEKLLAPLGYTESAGARAGAGRARRFALAWGLVAAGTALAGIVAVPWLRDP